MKRTPQQTVTQLLQNYDREDQQAVNKLFEHVYDELYKIARGRRRKWHGNETMNTTAVLHEAYLKLVDQSEVEWQSRTHFFAAASKVMRHILINYARDKNRQKRGGDQERVSFEKLNLAASGKLTFSDEHNKALIALDEALKRLEGENEKLCKIVECRFFGGMTIEETAEALGISPSTVKRGWKTAQLWIYRELKTELESAGELDS
ncbi:sigma-70 family RNA polymerase sigma factor [Rhodohalobacter sulfatireducens]|uniref:Sigma-70 family RNA polymerase sigma factor n=1 Tax=Rhodohalobacter sulfatireducens TaxID=2911366 RepID=A0ABS9KJR5_9BACT|nr:sigma-70 family RNA polymerase sigma factor [Rhodohalobacter sulfatireducens]MCG2591090.1 sigma-70 family RNA polymerase sigma factor [Rhodohalobacter sulfatireducens]